MAVAVCSTSLGLRMRSAFVLDTCELCTQFLNMNLTHSVVTFCSVATMVSLYGQFSKQSSEEGPCVSPETFRSCVLPM
jgi:uncharacterized membrane protein YiaA